MADGEPALDRALGTATILAGLQARCRLAARCAPASAVPVAGAFDGEAVAARFGADVAALVARRRADGRHPRGAGSASKAERAAQAENLRKMLLAMVEDIRVVLIKLAERTQALRYADRPAMRRARARRARGRSTCSRRSPTGSASGSSSGSSRTWRCARSSPRPTSRSRALLDERRARPRALHRGRDRHAAQSELAAAGIDAEVTGRPKHIYSICNKMQRKDVEHRRALRHPRRARPGRRRQGLLRGARPRAQPVDAARRASSTTTSRSRRPTTTGRCTRR